MYFAYNYYNKISSGHYTENVIVSLYACVYVCSEGLNAYILFLKSN